MPDALARRVGPLPVWGWIVAALVGFLWWSSRNRPGYFPVSTGTTNPPSGGGDVISFGMSGESPTEPYEDEDVTLVGGGDNALDRPALPSSIIESGGGGIEKLGGGGVEKVIPLYGPGGAYSYTGGSRLGGGGGGLRGNIGYGGGRR